MYTSVQLHIAAKCTKLPSYQMRQIPVHAKYLDLIHKIVWGAQWLSGRVLDSKPRGRGFESHWRHCVVSFSKNINPSLVLVQPRKTRPFITERLLMRGKESNQTNKSQNCLTHGKNSVIMNLSSIENVYLFPEVTVGVVK